MAILDQRAPKADWAPLKRKEILAKWRKALTLYQKQLRSSFTRYRRAKKEWKQAEESRWQRITRQAGKLGKVCQQLLLEFLEVLRFVVQALQPEKERARQEIAGLHSELAVPKGLMNTMDIAPTKPDMEPSP